MQTIQRLARAAFRCNWQDVPNSTLKLNFDVIIAHFWLAGDFCLMHWQAKPKYLRRWGIYCSSAVIQFANVRAIVGADGIVNIVTSEDFSNG